MRSKHQRASLNDSLPILQVSLTALKTDNDQYNKIYFKFQEKIEIRSIQVPAIDPTMPLWWPVVCWDSTCTESLPPVRIISDSWPVQGTLYCGIHQPTLSAHRPISDDTPICTAKITTEKLCYSCSQFRYAISKLQNWLNMLIKNRVISSGVLIPPSNRPAVLIVSIGRNYKKVEQRTTFDSIQIGQSIKYLPQWPEETGFYGYQ